jgi:murein DD-endopeptidase MepM/ murein hydrolase activator NlpD
MRKNFSFFLLSNSGSPIKQVNFSKGVLYICGLVCFTGLLAFTYFTYDYIKLRKRLVSHHALEQTVSGQSDEIADQRRQIQNFASEINTLKSKLVELNTFEKKIRIIANLDQNGDSDTVFGVGGSIPEDLDPNLELRKSHTSLLREMHEQVGQLNLASIHQEKGFESLYDYLDNQRNLLASTPAIRPTKGWKTSTFGYRISPFTGRREFHKGLDIASRIGTPIIAPADGIVKYVGKRGLLGRMLVIDHGHGMVTRYGHLNKYLKKKGEAVKRGDIIAEMGNSGRSTGPHLHYEVHLNGIPVNPTKYILN